MHIGLEMIEGRRIKRGTRNLIGEVEFKISILLGENRTSYTKLSFSSVMSFCLRAYGKYKYIYIYINMS